MNSQAWLNLQLPMHLGSRKITLSLMGFAWRLPSLRVEARQMIVAVQPAAGDPGDEATGSFGIEPEGESVAEAGANGNSEPASGRGRGHEREG